MRSCPSAALLLGWTMVACGSPGEPDEPRTRPNFVIVFADDLGYGDLSSYGHPSIETPHLDRLAADGQRWTDFYVAAPVCTPSRAALLTGRLPVRSGIYGEQIGVYFPQDPGGLPESEITIAELLGEAGYRTAIYGKWHLGDRREAWPTRHGFDEWWGVPYSNDMDWELGPDIDGMIRWSAAGRTTEMARLTAQRREQYFSPRNEFWNVPLFESRRLEDGSFEDAVLERSPDQSLFTGETTRRAISFLEQRAEDSEPFFLYLPLSMPHTPIFSDASFTGTSRAGRYGDVIEEIDHSVGQLRSALERLDLADDTVLIFTSDNGPWLAMGHHGGSPGPLNNGKGTTFDGGQRVPAIWWAPGRIHRGTVRQLGSTLDLLPTLAKLAEVDLPPVSLDGLDLGPTLADPDHSARDQIVYYRQGELQAMRQGRWKLRLVSAGAYSMPPERTVHEAPQLFDLHNDPGERHDLSSRHPEVVQALTAALEAHEASFERAPPQLDRRIAAALAVAAPDEADE